VQQDVSPHYFSIIAEIFLPWNHGRIHPNKLVSLPVSRSAFC